MSCYDAILLGTLNRKAFGEIKNKLVMEWGIEESKIIDRGYQPLLKGGGIIDVDNPNEIVHVVKMFGKNEYGADKSIKYLTDFLMSIGNESEYTTQLRRAYLTEENYKSKIVFAYLLYRSGNWDQKMMKDYHDFLFRLSDSHLIWAHRAVLDVGSFPALRYPEYRYYEYYMDRKAILRKVSDKMLHEGERKLPKKGKENNKDRLAFCCFQLYGKEMHLTKIISGYANQMAKMGKTVKVFVENRHYEAEEFFLENTYGNGMNAAEFRESNRSLFIQEVEIYYAVGKSMREKTEDFFEKVCAYNPEAVFYYNGESSCMTYNLVKYFPVINVMTIQMGSCAEYHILAAVNKNRMLEMDRSYKFIEDKERIQQSPLFFVPPNTYKIISREDLQIEEDAFVLITVGNRLQYEIKDDFVNAVCDVLVRNNFVWILVGCSCLQYVSENYQNMLEKKKIRFVSYEEDLCALYKICDVYLNPQRVGGGTSVAWAMFEKLPVLTIRQVASDGFAWVGEELAIGEGYQNMMQELLRLYRDDTYRECQKERFKARIDSFNIIHATEALLEMAEKAKVVFDEQMEVVGSVQSMV